MGVTSTRSAWIDRHEVVTIEFLPEVVDYKTLLETAKEHGCASHAWATTDAQLEVARDLLGDKAATLEGEPRDAKESDQLYYLLNTSLRYLPLTPLQARRVNGALYTKGPRTENAVERWLSPRQIELRDRIDKALGKDEKALSDLERPSDPRRLAEYTNALEKALTAALSPDRYPRE